MLGGGGFVAQNKVLPGSYINFVNSNAVTSTIGERGVVAIMLPLNKKAGEVIEITSADFVTKCEELTGKNFDAKEIAPLREIFCNAKKVYVYDLGEGGTVAEGIAALEAYEFNVLCAYSEDVTTYITAVKKWRDEMGKKCQVVVYNQSKPDYEGIINVVSTVSDENVDAYALVAWVAGAEAACAVNSSCTNMAYDGEYTIVCNKSQSDLEKCITDGQLAFHLVYGEVRVLEDINSLTTTSAEKSEDFKYNQTIRVVDQIANDIAKLFNTKYLGKIANNPAGRVSLWADIVKHHRTLEELNAIENFNATAVTVEQGNTKKSVVINDVITVVNAMAQLYMTVVVQ